MKKLLSVLMAGTMALSLAACGSGSGGANTFTFASELDIKNLDSCDADDGTSFNAMHAVIDGLMGVDDLNLDWMKMETSPMPLPKNTR